MRFLGWMALAGLLLLAIALSSAYVRRLPITTAIVYLAVGVVLGPFVTGVLHVDLRTSTAWLEPLTEVAVVVALFLGGLKLRLPLRDPAWRAPLLLAGPVMLVCIAGVALVALALGLPFADALLVGAILAPTDPVLAGEVAVEDALDRSRMRYALSGEAGLNDGAAFPFVVLALRLRESGAGPWLAGWVLHRIVWAIPAALALGFASGQLVGWLAIRVRSRHGDRQAPNDFFALALIALTYVAAEKIAAWGFLAVFAAGVGLRRAEIRIVRAHPHPARDAIECEGEHPPAEHLVSATERSERMQEPAVAAGALVADVLSFGETCERLLEVLLVVLVGAAMGIHFDARGLVLAAALLLVLRPAATTVALRASAVSAWERPLVGWLGIRGIGSVYYLTYALAHGVTGASAAAAAGMTLPVIAASVIVHGVSAQPLLARAQRGAAPG